METQDISGLYTLKSIYDNDSIVAVVNGEEYRIKMSELIKILDNRVILKVTQPRKHKYLNFGGIEK